MIYSPIVSNEFTMRRNQLFIQLVLNTVLNQEVNHRHSASEAINVSSLAPNEQTDLSESERLLNPIIKY